MSPLPATPGALGTRPLVEHLAGHAERAALLTADGEMTYAQLAARVDDAVRQLGATRRLVLLPMSSSVDAVVWYLAALAGRHVVLLTDQRAATVTALRQAYDPDVVLSPGRADPVHAVREGSAHHLHPDLALLLSTSGSTGSPKLVRLSRHNLLANARSIATYLDLRADDRGVTSLPLHYCYGLSVLHSHLLQGAAVVLTERSVVDDAFWELVGRHRVTSLAGVPYTFELLERVGFADRDLPHLRLVTQAGGRLAPERVRALAELGERRGFDLFVMYGQTEATARMAYLPPGQAISHPQAVGVAVPGGELSLADVGDDGTGELVYTGPNVMMGYAHTAADLSRGAEVRALRTGDLARRGPTGLYEVVGRVGRTAKVHGLRIDLDRVEAALGAGALCVDGEQGLVVATEGGDALEVARRAAAASGLPRRAVRVVPVERLPRLPSGKPDRAAVQALAATAPAPGVPSDLCALFAEVLDRPDVGLHDCFVGLGGDSLSYVELSVRLEQALGVLPPDWHTRTVGQLAASVPDRRPRRRQVETSLVLRAVGMLLIVGTHAELFTVKGGAHVLLAVVGFNLARFHLTAAPAAERCRSLLRAAARVAVPSVLWIGLVFLLTDLYRPSNVLLLHGVLGPDDFGTSWAYWFVETVVWTTVALALLLRLPAVHALERRSPFGFALGLLGLGLLLRFEVLRLDTGPDVLHTPHLVLWCVALGWCAAVADAPWQRVLVSAAAVLAAPGFFPQPSRTVLVIAGVLLLVWCRTLPLPGWAARTTGVLAASSLYLYLSHFQVYRVVPTPLLGVLASLVVGVLLWRLSLLVGRRWRQRVAPVR